MEAGVDEPAGPPAELHAKDLGLELLRQHTLLTMLTVRLSEMAGALARGIPVGRERIERALEVHRRFLVEVHHGFERLVAEALAKVRKPQVRAQVEECARSHPRAQKFQDAARAALASDPRLGSETLRTLSQLFRQEAERIDAHHSKEDELYRDLDHVLPPATRQRLLRAIRKFDERRITAEISLVSWASQIHPSAD